METMQEKLEKKPKESELALRSDINPLPKKDVVSESLLLIKEADELMENIKLNLEDSGTDSKGTQKAREKSCIDYWRRAKERYSKAEKSTKDPKIKSQAFEKLADGWMIISSSGKPNVKTAKEFYGHALKANPNNYKARLKRCEARFYKTKQDKKTQERLEKVIKDLTQLLGVSGYRTRKVATLQAEVICKYHELFRAKYTQELGSLGESLVEAKDKLGHYYLGLTKRGQEAIAEFSKALEGDLTPADKSKVLLQRALAYRSLPDNKGFESALEDHTAVIDSGLSDAAARSIHLYHRGLLYEQSKSAHLAISDLTSSRLLDPDVKSRYESPVFLGENIFEEDVRSEKAINQKCAVLLNLKLSSQYDKPVFQGALLILEMAHHEAEKERPKKIVQETIKDVIHPTVKETYGRLFGDLGARTGQGKKEINPIELLSEFEAFESEDVKLIKGYLG